MEMHRSQFPVVWFSNVNIKRLTLINESTTIGCHLNDGALRNLPDGFVQILNVLWDSVDFLLFLKQKTKVF